MSYIYKRALCLLCLMTLLCGATAWGTARAADGATPQPLRVTKGSQDGGWKDRVVRMSWYDGGSGVLKKGKYGYIYDIDTGIVVHIKRTGGTGHADCEPASKSDTAKLRKIAGGSFSWDSHAVILYAGGKFVACGISTKPHGKQTITGNGFNGQFCLHMADSKTHGDEVSAAQQKSVARAYAWAHRD